jgi:CheY-like chemotaxis protein
VQVGLKPSGFVHLVHQLSVWHRKGEFKCAFLLVDDAAIARSIELMLMIEEINGPWRGGVDLGKIYDRDIILLDLNLSDISGYEALRSLRSAKVVYASLDPFRAREHRGQDQGVGPWR